MNNTLIETKIEALIELLEKLKLILHEHQINKPLQEFLLYAAEKKAEEVVELAVSINQEVLKTKNKISKSYYDSFIDLSLFGIQREELKPLAATAGFRNRLAHEYLTVDPTVALRTMKEMQVIYPKYIQKIKRIMKN